MNKNRLYLDVHVLQVLPPSCVNRDDTNTPKTCIYGGKIRSRVSSQCWKRATRLYMRDHELADVGLRTKKFKSCVIKVLKESYAYTEENAIKEVEQALKLSGVASEKEDKKDTIGFFSMAEVNSFAKVIAESDDAAKKDKGYKNLLIAAVKDNPSTDILLFGRMFASEPSLDYDASCQVAHAISVNEARTEYDYFTAVDDIPDKDHNGSAYLDTKQFTDPILYRYANVNLSETSELVRLNKENEEAILNAVRAFLEAFVLSMPTGSSNAYANMTLPDYIMVTLRDDMPVSYAPAFIEVVKTGNFEEEAEKQLEAYADKVAKNYGKAFFVMSLKDKPFREIIDATVKAIEERL